MSVTQKAGSGLAGDTLYNHINTTGDKRGAVSKYEGITFIFGLSESVSDRLIKILQDYFMIDTLGLAFNAALAKVNKEVVVLDEFNKDTMNLPQIVINAVPSDNVPLSLGNKLGMESFGDYDYDVYGGDVNHNVTISLYDAGKPNVQQLADIVFLALMQYIPTNMATTFMHVQPQVRFSNATKQSGDRLGGEYYLVRVTVPIRSEWRQFMKIDAVDTGTIRETASVDGGVTPLK